ncbi:thymidine phosphorylase [Desulfurobacterium atlanticum]|uniref:thymidine phosphorylase n=1 Tax=Desulfurobacterium atlanticum TaxID=240169 RepID=A0A238YXC0_9BACT|nr:thymidine phosphorylase [Desulfurobacterium atlanticum]SNR75401.1 pyrimidine-nucleoside phosphorylase [Desulfurobacterium atlanticum]
MLFKEIIKKKRDGFELSEEEIRETVKKYVSEEIPDYQMAALLMAIYFKGMTDRETLFLTDAMLKSGETVNINIDGTIVDKHSTGGIGDKVSFVIAPVLAELGLPAVLLSGRALGFTGGTADKMESTGMKVTLNKKEIEDVVKKFGFSISCQTREIAPADRKIYALRDATSTVESIPLIVSSILSKKLCINTDGIVFDVKVGSGAFMKKMEDAEKLAEGLVNVSKLYGKKAGAAITEMNQPLGRTAGNAIEIEESLNALSGDIANDLLEVVTTLVGIIFKITKKGTFKEGKEKAENIILSGKALPRFCEWIEYLGGTTKLPKGKNKICVKSKNEGYITKIDGETLGFLIVEMGGGRKKKEDKIDYTVGLRFFKKIGSYVKKGETIGEIIFNSGDETAFVKKFLSAFKIEKEKREKPELIKKIIY